MLENLKEIKKEELLAEVQKCADAGKRFVITVCNDLGEQLEVTYFFNDTPGMNMSALRVVFGKDEVLPSITKIYVTAVLNENELKELFAVKINDIAIDFGGHMLLTEDAPVAPMLKKKAATAGKGSE